MYDMESNEIFSLSREAWPVTFQTARSCLEMFLLQVFTREIKNLMSYQYMLEETEFA